MIYLKTDEEIELMRVSNLLVGKTLGELSKWIAPGITTLKLDKIAEEFIRDNGGVPGFLKRQRSCMYDKGITRGGYFRRLWNAFYRTKCYICII